MPEPTPLSPAAQALVDAIGDRPSTGPDSCMYESIEAAAIALRIAADQSHSQEITRADWVKQTWILKDDLLAIATELERVDD